MCNRGGKKSDATRVAQTLFHKLLIKIYLYAIILNYNHLALKL